MTHPIEDKVQHMITESIERKRAITAQEILDDLTVTYPYLSQETLKEAITQCFWRYESWGEKPQLWD